MFLFSNNPLSILKKNRRVIALSGLFIALLSGGVTLLFPFEYRADAQALIISKSRAGVDPYTVVKSAERVGENLAAVMKTDDFFQKVMDQNSVGLDRTPFDNIPDRIRRRRWVRSVKASVVYGTGVLNVSAYAQNPDNARALAGAVVDTLAAKGWEYVGGDVTIKVVNQPVVTRFPVRPNIFLNIITGFFIGVLLSGAALIRRG